MTHHERSNDGRNDRRSSGRHEPTRELTLELHAWSNPQVISIKQKTLMVIRTVKLKPLTDHLAGIPSATVPIAFGKPARPHPSGSRPSTRTIRSATGTCHASGLPPIA